VYTAGEVLTAADLNITNSGIPVFASTVERDAAFGGTGEKVLAEGQYAYLESTNQTLVYDGSNWISVGVTPGLVFIAAQTIGAAVSSVAVTGVFSSTYDNYKVTVSGGAISANNNVALQLGATTTGYYAGYSRVNFATGATAAIADNNAANFARAGAANTNGIVMNFDLLGPNLAKNTFIAGTYIDPLTTSSAGPYGGFVNDTTAYTAFTIIPAAGTLTGGVIRVYGYANS
jgi:hypothetical protein